MVRGTAKAGLAFSESSDKDFSIEFNSIFWPRREQETAGIAFMRILLITLHCYMLHVTLPGVTPPLPTLVTVWCVICDTERLCDAVTWRGALLRGHTNKLVTFIGHEQLTWGSPPGPAWAQCCCCKYYFVGINEGWASGLARSRYNLIKPLPATPRGVSLYRSHTGHTEPISPVFFSIRDHKMNVCKYFLALQLSWDGVQILFIIIN